ncbi:MAG: tRNA lysidine(34) synthetase TilS [Alphaproteobacteria bacterium]|nr:tRNA lysidine(34) synthetase TilS [Alphaproteobacteria bacterium]
MSAQPISRAEFAVQMAAGGVTDGVARVAVAVSGGADSMALALLARDWAEKRGALVHVLTVDHGLRPESRREAEQVSAWLGPLGLDVHILTWRNPEPHAGGVQARAREARYALITGWCRTRGVDTVLAAHHREDQAETVLMRLRKGTGLLGLAAMPARRPLGEGVTLVRPLLDTPKARLRATLRAAGQDWIEDPSNRDGKFERVRARALLAGLADEGVTPDRLARAARAAGYLRRVLEAEADDVLERAVTRGSPPVLDRAVFFAAHEVVREIALGRLLARIGGDGYPPRRVKMARLAHWMADQDGRPGDARTLAGCLVRRRRNGFAVRPAPPRGTAR